MNDCLYLSLSMVACVYVRVTPGIVPSNEVFSCLHLISHWPWYFQSFGFIAGFCVLQLELNENDVLFQHWDMIVKKLLGFTVSTVGTIVS